MSNSTIFDDPEYGKLLRMLRRMKVNSDIFTESFMNDVRPRWYKVYKDGEFRMIIVNRAYTQKTGITLPAYYMRNDDDLWDDNTAQQFNDSDNAAVNKRTRIMAEEIIINPLTNTHETWVVFKTPRFDPKDGKVIGVHGQAQPWETSLWETVPRDIKNAIKMAN